LSQEHSCEAGRHHEEPIERLDAKRMHQCGALWGLFIHLRERPHGTRAAGPDGQTEGDAENPDLPAVRPGDEVSRESDPEGENEQQQGARQACGRHANRQQRIRWRDERPGENPDDRNAQSRHRGDPYLVDPG